MRVGKILHVSRVPDSDNLYAIDVSIGTQQPLHIVSSLVPYYSEQELLGMDIIVLVNLETAKIRGEQSEGMLLAAETEDSSQCVLITPASAIPAGTKIL